MVKIDLLEPNLAYCWPELEMTSFELQDQIHGTRSLDVGNNFGITSRMIVGFTDINHWFTFCVHINVNIVNYVNYSIFTMTPTVCQHIKIFQCNCKLLSGAPFEKFMSKYLGFVRIKIIYSKIFSLNSYFRLKAYASKIWWHNKYIIII